MPNLRNRPRPPYRRLSKCLTGRQATAVPISLLGYAGQQWASNAGPMDSDTLNAFATGGSVNRSYRPAASLVCRSGRILDFFIAQQDGVDDYRVGAIYMRYSTDNGQTWSAMQCIYRRETSGTPDFLQNSRWIDGPIAVAQHTSGRIHLIFTKSDGAYGSETKTMWHITSTDDGANWNGAAMATNPTNISSSVIKANNTTPAGIPACYTAGASSLNSPWLWNMPTGALCVQNGANAGRIVVFADHKYTSGGVSWSHCFYTDNGDSATPTWVLGGGYEENTSNNENTNETTGVEIGSSGSILTSSRVRAGGNQLLRAQTTITQSQVAGSTWTTAAISVDGSAAQIDFNSAHGSLWKNGNYIYLACATNKSLRAHLRVYRSVNSGSTWVLNRTLCYGYAGYCYGQLMPNGVHRVLFERTHNFGIESFSAQYVVQRRFNDHWLENESLYPDVHEWGFTEAEQGVSMGSVGTPFLDVGFNGERSFDERGFGGANVNYVLENSRWKLQFLGSGTGCYLQEAIADAHGGPCDAGKKSLTFEFCATLAVAGAGAKHEVFDNCNESGKGMSIYFNTSGQLVARLSDGTNTATTTAGGADFNDGAEHTFAVVADRAGSLACYDTTSGTPVLLGSAASLSSVTGFVHGSQKGVLGRLSTTNSNHMAANSTIDRIRITHKAITSGWMGGSTQRKWDHSDFIGTEPTFPTIANYPSSNVILHALPTYDFGFHARQDAKSSGGVGGAHDHVPWGNGIIKLGQGLKGHRDVASHTYMNFGNSDTRGAYWDYDSDIGYHYRLMYLSVNANGCPVVCNASGVPAYNSAFDIIQETGVFAFYICYKLLTDGTVVFLDTTNNSAVNGFTLYQASGGGNNIWMRYVNSTPTAINENITPIGNLATNQWNNLMVTGNGSGKFRFFKAVTTGRVVGSITGPTQNSTGNITAPGAGTSPATGRPLAIGARGDTNANAANLRVKNAILIAAYHGADTNAFAALCALSANY